MKICIFPANIKYFVFCLLFFITFSSPNLFANDSETDIPTYSDSSTPIKVELGKKFAIVLESNPTTGYKWDFSKPPDRSILEFSGSKYIAPESTPPAGAGGKEVWTFKAANKGTALIVLKYVRPWEKDMYPLETRTFVVEVQN